MHAVLYLSDYLIVTKAIGWRWLLQPSDGIPTLPFTHTALSKTSHYSGGVVTVTGEGKEAAHHLTYIIVLW